MRARDRLEKRMEQVVVFGTQVQVLGPAVPLGLNNVIPVAEFRATVRLAGYGGADAENAVIVLLSDAGYDIPSAWATVVRSELIAAGIVPGRVNALQAEMLKTCIRLCGTAFARVLRGTETTDADVAQQA